MPREQVPGTDLSYHLIAFNANGRERTDDRDGQMSALIKTALASEPITDVFVISHGWNGDVPAARNQYNDWIKAMHDCSADRERMRQARPGFHPLIIGIHWPSLPWGDESLVAGVSISAGEPDPVEGFVEAYAQRIADTETARQALRTILTRARAEPPPEHLPAEVLAAYQVLDRESGLGYEDEGARPGDDRMHFDPEEIYELNRDEIVTSDLIDRDSWLAPLRTLSFWRMKSRACFVGEHGVGDFFRALLQTAKPEVRFHLMGHSFGCIVVSALVNGPNAQTALPRPVNSLVLVQGALSLWAYCSSIPSRRSQAGYFHRLIKESRVQGPILTTNSAHDLALGTWYVWGATSARQVILATGQFPTYGAIGAWGIRGQGVDLVDQDMLPVDQAYNFAPQRVYNLQGSHVIQKREGLGGAHNDIARPEVAHAVWSAAHG